MTTTTDRCPECCGTGFVQGPAKETDDISYPTLATCLKCNGSGAPIRQGLAPPEVVKPARGSGSGKDWAAAAETWIDSHREVIEVFMRLARAKAARGKKFGISALTEVVRWECDDLDMNPEEFRINNNYRAYIARRLILLDPSLEKFIEFRVTRWE